MRGLRQDLARLEEGQIRRLAQVLGRRGGDPKVIAAARAEVKRTT